MGRKKRQKEQDLKEYLGGHLMSLSLSLEEYQSWCIKHGFKSGYKNSHQLREEIKLRNRELADRKLKKGRKVKDPIKVLKAFLKKKISKKDIYDSHLRSVCDLLDQPFFKDRVDQQNFLKLLDVVEASTNLLREDYNRHTKYLIGLAYVSRYHRHWIRPVENWKAKSHNSERQFSSLVRHLFAKYEIPAFMDSVWFNGVLNKEKDWFIFLGLGNNIRKAEGLPFPLTKKMAHHFLSAPKTYTVHEAIRWGQIHALGGDEHLVEAILPTRIGQNFSGNTFWESVIRFFINNPMLDRSHVGPIIDYVHNQKFVPRVHWPNRFERVDLPPAQPNLSMKDRDPIVLLREVDAWHGRINREKKSGKLVWEKSRFADFEHEEKFGDKLIIWKITELLSSKELIAEGRALNHCVASYASSCQQGRISIWSLSVEDFNGEQRICTLEVTNDTGRLVQARAKNNALVSEKYMKIVRRWASNEGIEISRYI